MILENVRGAQKWVSQPSRWAYGSYVLWGDVPALMPYASGRKSQYEGPRSEKPPGTGKTSWFFGDSKGEGRLHGLKVEGFNFHAHEKTGQPGGSFQSAAVKVKRNMGQGWFGEYGAENDHPIRNTSSRSDARKQASALIAKIPFNLSSYIAEIFKPR